MMSPADQLDKVIAYKAYGQAQDLLTRLLQEVRSQNMAGCLYLGYALAHLEIAELRFGLMKRKGG